MTTNDVHARSDRMKTGRMELLMKMFSGYEEPENVLDALEELEALNNAHNSLEKVFNITMNNARVLDVRKQFDLHLGFIYPITQRNNNTVFYMSKYNVD